MKTESQRRSGGPFENGGDNRYAQVLLVLGTAGALPADGRATPALANPRGACVWPQSGLPPCIRSRAAAAITLVAITLLAVLLRFIRLRALAGHRARGRDPAHGSSRRTGSDSRRSRSCRAHVRRRVGHAGARRVDPEPEHREPRRHPDLCRPPRRRRRTGPLPAVLPAVRGPSRRLLESDRHQAQERRPPGSHAVSRASSPRTASSASSRSWARSS